MRSRTHSTARFGVGSAEPTASGKRAALEVTAIWNGMVQSVVEKAGDEKGDAVFTVGEDPHCDFVVPASDVGGQNMHVLASLEGGVLFVNPTGGMVMRILREDGVPRVCPSAFSQVSGGGERFAATVGDTAEIAVGPVLFRFRGTEPLQKVKGRIAFDRRTGGFVAFSALLHAAVLFGLWLVPPNATGLHMDNLDHWTPIMKVMLSAPEARIVEPPKPETSVAAAQSGGAAHEGAAGQMGDRQAKKTENRSAIAGPRDNPTPVMMRDRLKENIEEQGILAIMSAVKMPVSPFGSDTPVGFDPENALGDLVGRDPGVNLGLGGLGPKGTGRGGGGNAKGGIGVGRLGRIAWSLGEGNCTGAACPNWTGGVGKGDMNGRKRQGPELRSGTVGVVGSLSKETIRRIVRRHLNEVRFCYEQGLQKRPDLGGQVSIKFTIADTGKVQAAYVSNSTLGDAKVAACIAQTVNRMTFPAPKNGGIVIVTYPFSLTASM